MLKAYSTAILTAVALALAACGGSDNAEDNKDSTTAQTPTATPTATATATATPGKKKPPRRKDDVKGIDVYKVGQARDRFVKICADRKEDAEARKDAEMMTELRKTTTTLVRAFRSNPDEKFKRSPGVPELAMRARLVSLGYIARRSCGGGSAVAIGERITRELARRPQKS